MKKFLLGMLVCAAPAMAAPPHARPPDLQLVEKIELAPLSREEAAGGTKPRRVDPAPGKEGTLRVSPEGAPAFFVRNERREGVVRRTDGPEMKGQAPTLPVWSW